MIAWIHEMEKVGYKARILDIRHLSDLKKEYEHLKSNHVFTEELQTSLDHFYDFEIPHLDFPVKSVLVVASKSLPVLFTFDHRGRTYPVTLPPTYIDFISEVQSIIETFTALPQHHASHILEATRLPNKMLAAASGLGAYGKNNLIYVDGLGSFVLLSAYYTDVPCPDDVWAPFAHMPLCERCHVCMNQCPTQAITPEKKTIRTDRCLTTYNESSKYARFPEWIQPLWHNCLVGCLRCQLACPQNTDHRTATVPHTHFQEDETALILQHTEKAALPETVFQKLEHANLLMHYDYLARNLAAVLV